MNDKPSRMDYRQHQAARRLVHECCNYDEGNCLLLDDGEPCVCVQSISYSLMCRWFRVAVLPLDGELAAALLYRGSRKRCAVCGAAFVPKSNRGKYCPGKLGLVTGTVSLNGMTADEDWQVDRLREDGDPNHDSDIQRAVDKANKAREQGADVVAIAMHSVQEYLDYADSWQISEAHELADTGAFDVIYGAGCHCAQPIENYNGTWIIYGLGNAVTESANTPETLVNNQGVTARIQFAGKKGVKGSWRVNRIDWVPTANVHQGNYQWCPISSDHPIGTCWDEAYDAQIRQRIWDVIYSMGADQNVVKEWNITQEQAAKQ